MARSTGTAEASDEAAEVGGEEAAMGEAEGALGLAADQIVDRHSQVLAVIPSPAGAQGDVEFTYRQTEGRVAARSVVICEACVTVIDDKGNRTTRCVRIPCPKGVGPALPGGGTRV